MNPESYNQSLRSRITPGRVVIVMLLILVALGIYWLATHSYLEVTAPSNGNQLTYQLLNQSNQKTTTIQTTAGSVKKLVRKGSYEVYVSQDGKSYFSVTKAGGFLRKQSVNAQLQAENARRFVGNNPSSCMTYANQLLASYSCGDPITNFGIHAAATATSPTTVQHNDYGDYGGNIEGTVSTDRGPLVLVKAGGTDDTGATNSHFLYSMDGNFAITKSRAVPELDSNATYTAIPYQGGMLAYKSDFKQIVTYQSIDVSSGGINLEQPKTKNLLPVSLTVRDKSVVAMYAHSTEAGDKHPASEVVITNGQTTNHYTFSTNYVGAMACGDNQLCMMSPKSLDIYNLNSNKASLDFSVANPMGMENAGNDLLVARAKDVLRLDLSTHSGFSSYTFGDYTFGGITATGGDYILSLVQPNQQKVALYINQSAPNTDSIDKKVVALGKTLGVNTVSAYGHYIFVSPNVGSLKFIPSENAFGYDPVAKKTANDNINQAIAKLGIDRNVYTIVNTIQ